MNLLPTLFAQAEEAPDEFREWSGSYWFPEKASEFAAPVDFLFHFILWIVLISLAGITVAMILFVVRYRKRPGYVQEDSVSHNTVLEITWSVFPSLILVVLFIWGVWGFMDSRVPPDDAYEIQVVASQFAWEFTYPNGEKSVDLHLPKDVDVKFLLSSKDVLHSFFIPAFRQKRDCVPGRYAKTWVRATIPGTYRLYCAEYCGDGHSLMKRDVIVHDMSWDEMMEKIKWKYEDHSALENGQRVYMIRCAGCHSEDGTAKTGPSFLETSTNMGGKVALRDGSQVDVDENYLRESILNPAAKIRAGYQNQMPSFQGQLSEDEIGFVIAYIKSLKQN